MSACEHNYILITHSSTRPPPYRMCSKCGDQQDVEPEDDAALIDNAIALFNGGIVHLPDPTRPGLFVNRYYPKTAMRALIASLVPAIRAQAFKDAAKIAGNHPNFGPRDPFNRGVSRGRYEASAAIAAAAKKEQP